MGVDLQLLPFYGTEYNFSQVIVSLERRSVLWEDIAEIERLNGIPVDEEFQSYLSRQDGNEETHYGRTTTTPYGNRLNYVLIKHLKPLAMHECVRDNYLNRAAWAYLDKCPDELKIALYWS